MGADVSKPERHSTAISLSHLRKEYGEHVAIADLTLTIEEGEFFTLLGPSGCGKTTLLRMIAGFNSVEAGTIAFNETVVNDLPPGKRNIGMVFQNYALFPQMSVLKNVAFGLENRDVPRKSIPGRVERALDTVHMGGMSERLPGSMSGGQQQRVALARALVISPDVLLMDEPLSNLDAKLRVEMRDTIREAQRLAGITTVYVTHDQEEAMAVSDRIAVMSEGEVQHVGTPEAIYHRPATVFVADFIGKATTLDRPLVGAPDRARFSVDGTTEIDVTDFVEPGVPDHTPIKVSIRPEAVSVADHGIPSEILSQTFLGSHTQYRVRLLSGEEVEFIEFSEAGVTRRPGDTVSLRLETRRLNFFRASDGRSITRGVVNDASTVG